MALLVITVVAMLVVPLPPVALDVALSFNIALSVALLLIALHVREPLQIAAFPSLLLLTTLLRLGLEVSATRAILLKANAGEVIQAFGRFVIAGNLVVGVVVFGILTFIQFVVIARGAERVAEVAARFTLDALPGRQLAIDADLRAGHIDQHEAGRRRTTLARESQFFGAMDGAMKFVKGDALAGVAVLLTNIIGGLVVGIVQRGMNASAAVRTYTLLTVGQGLVAQIPALVVSTAAGLLVTRVSASDDLDARLGRDLGRQLLAHPRALGLAAVLMTGLALIPGLPAVPFLLLALLFGVVSFRLRDDAPETPTQAASASVAAVTLEVPPALVSAVRALLPAVAARRVAESGLPLPPVALRPGSGPSLVLLREVPVAQGNGGDGPAQIADLLFTTMKRHGHELFGIQETQDLLDALERTHPALVRETVPKLVSPVLLASVLGRLAEEGVSIRALPEVLTTLAEWSPRQRDPEALAEEVRATLRRQITHAHAVDGALSVYFLEPMIEEAVREAIRRRDDRAYLALEPTLSRDIVAAVARAIGHSNERAVLVTAADVRPHVRRLLVVALPALSVLSYRELTPETRLDPLGRIGVG